MNKMTAKTLLMVMGVSLTAVGCSTTAGKHGIAKTWADKFREYQILPVFPPREDFQVGDIVLTCEVHDKKDDNKPARKPWVIPVSHSDKGKSDNKSSNEQDEKEWLPLSLIVARLNVNTELDKFYKTSVAMPVDSAGAEGEPDASKKKPSLPQSDTLFSGNVKLKTLKNVAFPDFAAVTVKGSDLGTALPSGIVMSRFGFSKKDVDNVSISVPSAVSYQLPLQDLEDAIGKKREGEGEKTMKVELENKRVALQKLSESYGKENCRRYGDKAQLVLVSEVYAAYAITTEIGTKKALDSKLAGQVVYDPDDARRKLVDSSGMLKKSGDAAQANEEATPEGSGKGQQEAQPGEKAVNLVQDIEFPGVQVKSYMSSTTSIKMDRRFASPVVIGYKGFKLDFDDCGKLILVGLKSTGDSAPASAEQAPPKE